MVVRVCELGPMSLPAISRLWDRSRSQKKHQSVSQTLDQPSLAAAIGKQLNIYEEGGSQTQPAMQH